MLNGQSRHAGLGGRDGTPGSGQFPRATHYILGFSLVVAAAVFTLLHHFMTP